MPEYVIDFSEFSKVLDELLSKTSPEPKVKAEAESDMISKYKKLYEASIEIETLKKRRDEYEKYVTYYSECVQNVNSKIEELNKIFTN